MGYKDLIVELEGKLEDLESGNEDVLFKAEIGIAHTEKCIKKLQKEVVQKGFPSAQEEVHFFKYIKPQAFSRLIYYVKLYSIEGRRPKGNFKSQTKYLDKHIDKLQIYFNDNQEFYHYYRRDATFLDQQYFMRGKADIFLYPDTFHFFTDKQFSTSHDCTVATILAYDMLIVYLKTEIDKLENTNGMESSILSPANPSKLFWTSHKVDLIELIYALHSSGAINSGMADIKEIALLCEEVFNIKLGNYYHTFVEIRARKSNNTKFVDRLKESLIERYNEADQ